VALFSLSYDNFAVADGLVAADGLVPVDELVTADGLVPVNALIAGDDLVTMDGLVSSILTGAIALFFLDDTFLMSTAMDNVVLALPLAFME
jgi:hypothetical protein